MAGAFRTISFEFWATTGGGEIFETETLFKPLVPSAAEEGVEFATDWHTHRGMPLGLVVFHEGLEVSAVRCTDGMYLTLGADAQIARQFRSFEEDRKSVV